MLLHRNYHRILIACSLVCVLLVGCEVSEPNRTPAPTATTSAGEPVRPTLVPANAGDPLPTIAPAQLGQPGYPAPGYPAP